MLGKTVDPASSYVKAKIAHIGPVGLEVVQPIGGRSLWKEFFESKGEGIQHLAFAVDDINKAEAELVEKGLIVPYRLRFKNGGGVAYFDTGKTGGVLFELVQRLS